MWCVCCYSIHCVLILGSYCEVNTTEPVACPTGTYGSMDQLTMVEECTPCTAGSYCEIQGLTTVEGRVNYVLLPVT